MGVLKKFIYFVILCVRSITIAGDQWCNDPGGVFWGRWEAKNYTE